MNKLCAILDYGENDTKHIQVIINEVKFTLHVFMRVFASGKKYVCLLLVLKSDALSAFTVCFFL